MQVRVGSQQSPRGVFGLDLTPPQARRWGFIMATPTSDARTRARKLENDLDSRLVQLTRDGTGSVTLQREIEELLLELAEVNDRMSRDAAAAGGTATAMHMLQRHREILHDFQQEYNRSKAAIRAATERSQLLSSVREDIREHRCATSRRASDALLRERSGIAATSRAADGLLGQAHANLDAITQQRGRFGGMSSKLSSISSLAPQVNSLIGAISRRERRDKIILAVVIGLCIGVVLICARP